MDYRRLVESSTLSEIMEQFPVARDFFDNLNLDILPQNRTLARALESIEPVRLEEFGLDLFSAQEQFVSFLMSMETHQETSIRSITILGGKNKLGEQENAELTVRAGDVVSIVGPTGSGKSRLLGDIECLAQRDTPTGRMVLVDGCPVGQKERFEMDGRLVAQLSQNMNFVMDLNVLEFLRMHAQSRLCRDTDEVIGRCFLRANELAGEKFSWDTKVTQLSGGQSRALMIADTAYMSASPIVLIDEIENAGIDRREAIQLLGKKDKIVLVSTHDPLLALRADKRIIIKNGGIHRIIETTEAERKSLAAIERLDAAIGMVRGLLRAGEIITPDIFGRDRNVGVI